MAIEHRAYLRHPSALRATEHSRVELPLCDAIVDIGINLESECYKSQSTFDGAELNVERIILRFRSWLALTPLKPSTRRIYVSRLKQLTRFIEGSEYMPSVEEDNLENLAKTYISFIKEEYLLKPHSINNFVALFRLMAKVAGIKDFNLETHAFNVAERTTISKAEEEQLIAAAKSGNSSRDLLLVFLFLKTSVRPGEVVKIRVSDLAWEASGLEILIQGRYGQRIERLSEAVREALQAWLLERSRAKFGVNSEYLFYGATGGKITGSAIDAALRKIGWRAGLNVCARMLKNTYTTMP